MRDARADCGSGRGGHRLRGPARNPFGRPPHASGRPPAPPTGEPLEEAMREADLPAEPAEAQQEARISSADADPRGSQRAEDAASPRPRQALRLIRRVRGHGTFRELARTPSRRQGALGARLLLGDPSDPPAVAFAIPRAVGGAVERNRLRRRLPRRAAGARARAGARRPLPRQRRTGRERDVPHRAPCHAQRCAVARCVRPHGDRGGIRSPGDESRRAATPPVAGRVARGEAHPRLPDRDVLEHAAVPVRADVLRSTRSRPSPSTARSAARGSRSSASAVATRGIRAASTPSPSRTPVRMTSEAGS